MKRQDIISKLMNEGFTQKTLVNLTDKQLHILAERILSEQYATSTYGTTTSQPQGLMNVSRYDQKTQVQLKQQKKPFVTYEGEMKEQEKLGAEKKKEPTEKELTLKKIFHKMDSKMKKDESIKSEIELLQRMKEDIPEKYKKYCEKNTSKKFSIDVNEQKNNNEIKNWVNKLVEDKFVTSKNEIVELVQNKLNEQWRELEQPAPTTKPEINPVVEPDYDEDTDDDDIDPFRDPRPDVDPGPKAKKDTKKYISAETAKNIIIDLLKKSL